MAKRTRASCRSVSLAVVSKLFSLVLLHFLVLPHVHGGRGLGSYVFAFEELENNLHPSLLRRLLRFIEAQALEHKCLVFLTTHSNVTLDFFAPKQHASIIHVEHDGRNAKTIPVTAHFDSLHIIGDLGARPSDLLQANGIIWVEGPSDRIYLNKWIEIFSDGQLTEGRDYQIAYYGGSLLARYGFDDPDNADPKRSNLLQVNPRVIVIADGDRTAKAGKGSKTKDRVRKIKAEVERLPDGFIWITDAKEIENYIPASALAKVWSKGDLPDIGQYEWFFREASNKNPATGYLVEHGKKKSFDKVKLAEETVPLMSKDNLDRFDS